MFLAIFISKWKACGMEMLNFADSFGKYKRTILCKCLPRRETGERFVDRRCGWRRGLWISFHKSPLITVSEWCFVTSFCFFFGDPFTQQHSSKLIYTISLSVGSCRSPIWLRGELESWNKWSWNFMSHKRLNKNHLQIVSGMLVSSRFEASTLDIRLRWIWDFRYLRKKGTTQVEFLFLN